MGIDPTARKLHAGHYRMLDVLKCFQDHGHTPVLLYGDFTASIGDPTGKAEGERKQLDYELTLSNSKHLWKAMCKKYNGFYHRFNSEWLNNRDFVQDCFSHISVNEMLNYKHIKQRLKHGDMTMMEFCYVAYQAIDFHHLANTVECSVQIGGQDQYGNMVAGIHLHKRMTGEKLYAMTVPLLTDEHGRKLSKSEGDSI